MNGNEVKQWGVSVTGTKQIRGGEAIEITLEVSGDSLRRAVEKLKSMPFLALMPAVMKVVTFIEFLLAGSEAKEVPAVSNTDDSETEEVKTNGTRKNPAHTAKDD